MLACHNYWHWALYYIEKARILIRFSSQVHSCQTVVILYELGCPSGSGECKADYSKQMSLYLQEKMCPASTAQLVLCIYFYQFEFVVCFSVSAGGVRSGAENI